MIKVAIYGRAFQAQVSKHVVQLFELLTERNVEVWVYGEFKEFLTETYSIAENENTFTCQQDLPKDIKFMLSHHYTIEKRTLLAVEAESSSLFNGSSFALNDVTLIKRDTSAMITLKVSLNGDFLNEYWADGLIIATPTGSTAYSLSCGGPIISPGSGNFVITPISPHNLNVRPLVISDEDVLRIEIESRGDRFLLSCDSRTVNVATSEKIRIFKR